MESKGRLSPAHRDRLGRPAPQGFGAVAAFERDDRAAITVRVPHRLPDSRGNRTGRGVQTAIADFTHRAPAARCYRRAAAFVHTLPQFFVGACTRYRRSSHADARAGVQGSEASPDSLPRAHRTVVFLLPLRIGAVSVAGGETVAREHCRHGKRAAANAASRRASVSAQRPQGAEARGIAAEIARRAIAAYSPVAKRRAQILRRPIANTIVVAVSMVDVVIVVGIIGKGQRWQSGSCLRWRSARAAEPHAERGAAGARDAKADAGPGAFVRVRAR